MKNIFWFKSFFLLSILVLYACASQSITPTATNVNVSRTPSELNPIPQTSSVLNLDQQVVEIVRLLKSNNSCSFPCFLGVQPGVSLWKDVKAYFYHLNLPVTDINKNDGVIFHYIGFDMPDGTLGVRMLYIDQGGVVKAIHGGIGGENFTELAQYFLLQNVFSTYGQPSRIFVEMSRATGKESNIIAFKLWLFYDEKGFELSYDGMGVVENANYKICPFQNKPNTNLHFNTAMNFNSQAPDNKEPIEKIINSSGESILGWRDLNSVFNISIDDFYNSFVSDPESCFSSPIELWK